MRWWTRSGGPRGYGGARRFHALDIGSTSIKLLTVRSGAERVRVEAMAVGELPAGVMHGHQLREREVVAATIRRLVRAIGWKRLPVVVALPGPAVMVRHMVVRPLGGERLEAAVVREATAILPDAAERAVLDFQVVRPLPPDGSPAGSLDGSYEVVLVAARRELVQSYTGVIRAAGLEPRAVDVESLALERMFRRSDDLEAPDAPVALVHVGARYTAISVLRGERSAFVGDVPVTAAPGDGAALAEEVQRVLGLFWPDPSAPLGRVVLSGGASSRGGLAAAFESRLGCAVTIATPFRRVEVGKRVDREQLDRLAPVLAVAAGLALRRAHRS